MLIKIIKQASIVSLIVAICLGGLGISGSRAVVYAENVDSFMDNFDDSQKMSTLGYLASWSQGNIQWKAEHAEVVDGKLVLTFDNSGSEDTKYASAQFTTFKKYGYGRYSTSIKAAKNDGLITNFYVYSANEDWTLENLIEAKVLGGNPSKLNISWTKDNVKQEKLIPLDFDASADYNDYAFEWSEDSIKWYVNDKLVSTAIESIPSNPGSLIMNLMEDENKLNYTEPGHASFDYFKYHKFNEDDPDTGQESPTEVTPPRPTIPAYSFTDQLDSFNKELWYKSDGWGNGPDFNVGWQADHVEFLDGKMALRLDDTLSSGKPYSSGEFATTELHGYGRIEGSLKVAKGDGLVTSIFTYSPNADEIDIEILGKDTTKMETNYYVKGVRGLKAHAIIDLGFDASADFHDYAIEWSWNYIKWYVDGKLVRTVESNKGDLPSESSTIMINLWAGAGAAADTWTNKFNYPGTPIRAYFDYINFTPEISFPKPKYELQVGESTATSVNSLIPGGGEKDVTKEASYRLAGDDKGIVGFTEDGKLVGLQEGTSVIQATYLNTTALANVVIKNVVSGNNGTNGSDGSTFIPTPVNEKLTKLILKSGIADQIKMSDDIVIDIPAGATDQDLEISIQKVIDPSSLLHNKKDLLSSVYNVSKNKSIGFLSPLALTLKFDEKRLGAKQQPSVFYYDEIKKDWVELGGKIKGDLIYVEIKELAKFSVFAVEKEEVKNPTFPQFTDIANHWEKAELLNALDAGLIRGYSDHTFRPDNTINRAEFTVMLVKMLQVKNEGDSKLAFTDGTRIGDWAKQEISQATRAKIILGYEDGSFRPNLSITRNEMVAMITRALQLSTKDDTLTSLNNNEDIPSWARSYFAAAIEQGILKGRDNNDLAGFETVTRAEAVVMLLKARKQYNDSP